MVSGFCPPVSSSFLPNSQLSQHPSLTALPLTIRGQVPSWGQLGWQAVTGEEGEPWTGPRLESKGQGLEYGPLQPHLPDPPPPKTESKSASLPLGVPVFSPLCKCDGQDGQRGK